jgi:hypothetical protein
MPELTQVKCYNCGNPLTVEEWLEDGQRAVYVGSDVFGRAAFCQPCYEANQPTEALAAANKPCTEDYDCDCPECKEEEEEEEELPDAKGDQQLLEAARKELSRFTVN